MSLIEAKSCSLPAISSDPLTGLQKIMRDEVDGSLRPDDGAAFDDAARMPTYQGSQCSRMGETALPGVNVRCRQKVMLPELWCITDIVSGQHERGLPASDQAGWIGHTAKLQPEGVTQKDAG